MNQRFLASISGAVALAALPLLSSSLAAQQGSAPPDGRGAAPAAGRGAPPAPANYPPYTRPVSTFVPPRTPTVSPTFRASTSRFRCRAASRRRSRRWPLAAANRANGEFSYSLNERPKLPEGADRPAGRRRSGGRQDSADARGAGQAEGHHRQPGEDRVSRRPRAVPRARRSAHARFRHPWSAIRSSRSRATS